MAVARSEAVIRDGGRTMKDVFGKRQRERYQVSEGVHAIRAGEECPLLDVSMGGAALCYQSQDPWPLEVFELGILSANDDFYLSGILCESVSDEEFNKAAFLGSGTWRRHGVRFLDLTADQVLQLQQFILLNGMKETMQGNWGVDEDDTAPLLSKDK